MTTPKFTVVKPQTEPQKATRTTLDTILLTPELVAKWEAPPFQRPLRENDKVRALAAEIAQNGGVLPGVITVGILSGTKYIIDGQHRRHAFLLSGLAEGYADVRTHFFNTLSEMSDEFCDLNSQLSKMKPDDFLRGMEQSYRTLRYVHEKCKFVGYENIRRGDKAPLLSMATAVRTWVGSGGEVPAPASASAVKVAMALTDEEAEQMAAFLTVCYDAWGRDQAYVKLWGQLNLIITAWLYRRTVITQFSPKTPKLTKDLFRKCLMQASADSKYLDWLVGRNLGERDRSPAYDRLKSIFTERLTLELGAKPKMPAPTWSRHH